MTLRETIEAIRSNFPEGREPTNEANTLHWVVRPILESLGWGASQLHFEYPVRDGTRKTGQMDVALLKSRGGDPQAFVEVKKPSISLEAAVDQMLKYAYYSGVNICALANGFEWWLYLPWEKGKSPRDSRFAIVHIRTDSLEPLADDLQTYLGEKEVSSESAHESAKQALASRLSHQKLSDGLPIIWKKMRLEPDSRLVELVQERVTKEIHLRPTGDQIAAFLARPDDPVPRPNRPAGRSVKPVPRRKRQSPRRSIRPTSYRLWGVQYDVRSHWQVLAGVANALCERHPDTFVRTIQSIPRPQPRFSPDPTAFSRSAPCGATGWHIDVSLSAAAIYRYSRYLLTFFGHKRKQDLIIFPKEAESRFASQ